MVPGTVSSLALVPLGWEGLTDLAVCISSSVLQTVPNEDLHGPWVFSSCALDSGRKVSQQEMFSLRLQSPEVKHTGSGTCCPDVDPGSAVWLQAGYLTSLCASASSL